MIFFKFIDFVLEFFIVLYDDFELVEDIIIIKRLLNYFLLYGVKRGLEKGRNKFLYLYLLYLECLMVIGYLGNEWGLFCKILICL